MEIWKDVLGYEGLYQVSNLGRVKSLPKSWLNKYKAIIKTKEKILKPKIDPRGYYKVDLCKDKKATTKRIHRLVWEAFNGNTKLQVDHIIEGNKLDNRLCNLQAITNRQNVSKHYLTTKKSSQYTGVSWRKDLNKWIANININGKKEYIGIFDSESKAASAYQCRLAIINATLLQK